MKNYLTTRYLKNKQKIKKKKKDKRIGKILFSLLLSEILFNKMDFLIK